MAMKGTFLKLRRYKRVTLLRVSYWVCAIFELMALVPMLSPALFGRVMGIPGFHPGSDYTYAMGIAAVFTLGWILLLVWAEHKPVERKGVMLLTAMPVFVGNLLCGIYAASSGFVATAMMIPSWIAQTIIIALLGFSYIEAGKMERTATGADGATADTPWQPSRLSEQVRTAPTPRTEQSLVDAGRRTEL